MKSLDELSQELEDLLQDYRTWLPDATRSGKGYGAVAELRDLCNDLAVAIQRSRVKDGLA
jgi:hypothetical protein